MEGHCQCHVHTDECPDRSIYCLHSGVVRRPEGTRVQSTAVACSQPHISVDGVPSGQRREVVARAERGKTLNVTQANGESRWTPPRSF
ncbi:hypothetical protein UPYG_G00237490 [Umbra pygmaea]|uniref:Uncharacterized protein n=1 Tax=Umbra pygmaea TaxID=75934 RepID=A0ABD0WEN8_UMBPY